MLARARSSPRSWRTSGFTIAMRTAGITVVETGVGDRYVLEAMRDGGFVLGGEQSGHVVMSSHATTGDGILTGAAPAGGGGPLRASRWPSSPASVTKLPQVLINVRGVDRAGIPGSPALLAAVAAAEAELGDTGRVLLRPSGTEPVMRVMVEAATEEEAARISEELAAVVRAELAIA